MPRAQDSIQLNLPKKEPFMTAQAAAKISTFPLARQPEAEVDELFLERWSRRALSDRPLTSQQISTLFEAARWAPSA